MLAEKIEEGPLHYFDCNKKEILRISAGTMNEKDIDFLAQFISFFQQSAESDMIPPSLGDWCSLQPIPPLSTECYKIAESMVDSDELREKKIKAQHPEWDEEQIVIALAKVEKEEHGFRYSAIMSPVFVFLEKRQMFSNMLSWSVPKLEDLHSVLEMLMPELLSLNSRIILGICSGHAFTEAAIADYCAQNYPEFKVIATDEAGIQEQEEADARSMEFYPMWLSTIMRQSQSSWLNKYTASVNKINAVHAAATVPGQVLVCSWPQLQSSIVVEANNAHNNAFGHHYEYILYIGEARYGCTGSDEMFEMFDRDYTELKLGSCHQWHKIHDCVVCYKRGKSDRKWTTSSK